MVHCDFIIEPTRPGDDIHEIAAEVLAMYNVIGRRIAGFFFNGSIIRLKRDGSDTVESLVQGYRVQFKRICESCGVNELAANAGPKDWLCQDCLDKTVAALKAPVVVPNVVTVALPEGATDIELKDGRLTFSIPERFHEATFAGIPLGTTADVTVCREMPEYDTPVVCEPAQQPTETGKTKYPPDGLYEDIPCTCVPECADDCKGGCGCSACASAYGDAMEYHF
jgi:hypothetical protein